ncbi:MAG TPA: PA0069 family radical SAM protein [Steroidobacteraceae bacterium]|nr:PA0069 family radical SAM protein [Steroidobacteraceae bacterium]
MRPDLHQKGRGAISNRTGRFEALAVERVDDGWGIADEELPPFETTVQPEPPHGVITRNHSPDIPFDLSINPYRGCEHGCIYCASGDTPILMANGSQKPLGDLSAGDEIYGTARSGFYRRYVRTRVLAHWRTNKPAWRIRLADGTELVASADHRFLTERGWKFVAKADRDGQRPYLTVNNTLMGFGALASHARTEHSGEYRRGYLCGLIRGDGHIGVYKHKRLGRPDGEIHQFRLAMADFAALDRATRFLAGFGIGVHRFLFQAETVVRRRMEAIRTGARASVATIRKLIEWPDRPEGDWARGYVGGMFDAEGSFGEGFIRIANTDPRMIDVLRDSLRTYRFETVVETRRLSSPKPIHYVRVRGGLGENLRFIRAFDPSIERKRDIAGVAVKSAVCLDVVEVEPLGRSLDLFDITTGTGDFIANGVISHNCYARPSHQYMNLSAGLDFETRLFYKKDAAAHLREELNRKSYKCSPINLGANTDPYQPLERKLGVTRSILEVLAEARHPVTIVTKGSLVTRDIDVLARLAAERLVKVFVSVTTLDDELKRRMEPRAASPRARLAAIGKLTAAGIPTGVMYAPVVPAINDHELESVLEAAAGAGAATAGYVLLRLPGEVKDLFYEWLDLHFPDRARKVRSRIHELRGGRDNDPRFGHRMRGQGPWAALLKSRFEASCRKHGLGSGRAAPLTTDLFRPPNRSPDQMELW